MSPCGAFWGAVLPIARMCQPKRQGQSIVYGMQACVRVEYETSGLFMRRFRPANAERLRLLREAEADGADLRGARLDGADLSGLDVDSARIDASAAPLFATAKNTARAFKE